MANKKQGMKPETLMMSYGYKPHLSEGALKCPIFQTSTFVFKSAEEGKHFFEMTYRKEENKDTSFTQGLIYTRINNPDIEILEDRIALWDRGEGCSVFQSGMAAITTVFLEFLSPNDGVLISSPIYGGTDHFIQSFFPKFNIKAYKFSSTAKDFQIIEKLNALTTEDLSKIKMIYIETPANPTNSLIDISMCKNISNYIQDKTGQEVIVVVDNTFLGPVWQHPLDHGADLVLYSATKYIGGHSDVVAGAVVGSEKNIKRVKRLRVFLGNSLGPWDGWLLMRSLETLKLRVVSQAKNAQEVANYLDKHNKVEKVYFLGLLKEGSIFEIFKKQCKSHGSMLSFDIPGGEAECFKFLNNLKVIKLAVSLGGTESLAQHPFTMTHSSMSSEEKNRYGITNKMIRLSIGIENVEDIIEDIKQALEKV